MAPCTLSGTAGFTSSPSCWAPTTVVGWAFSTAFRPTTTWSSTRLASCRTDSASSPHLSNFPRKALLGTERGGGGREHGALQTNHTAPSDSRAVTLLWQRPVVLTATLVRKRLHERLDSFFPT